MRMQMRAVAKKRGDVVAHLCLNYEYGKPWSLHAGKQLSFLLRLHVHQTIALPIPGNYYFLKDEIIINDS